MSPIRDVSDLRAQAQRNRADRAALRYSIIMALIGLAAVGISALLPADDTAKAAQPAATDPAPAQVLEPRVLPLAPELSAYPLRLIPMMGEKLEVTLR